MKLYRVMEAFSTWGPDGTPRVYTEGQIVKDDDPALKGRDAYFMDAQDFAEREAGVEAATAAPGERRSLTKPVAKRTQKRTQKRTPVEPTDKPAVDGAPETGATEKNEEKS